MEAGGFGMLDGIAVMEYHQKQFGYWASSTEGCRISLTGARHGMAKQKVKVKVLETTAFPEMLSVRIILKLKKLGEKIL